MVHMGRSRVGLVVNIKEKIIADGPSPIDIMRTRSIRPEFRVFYRRYRDISGEGLPWEIGRNQFPQPKERAAERRALQLRTQSCSSSVNKLGTRDP